SPMARSTRSRPRPICKPPASRSRGCPKAYARSWSSSRRRTSQATTGSACTISGCSRATTAARSMPQRCTTSPKRSSKTGTRGLLGEVKKWIDGRGALADLEMQLRALGIRAAEFVVLRAGRHRLLFLHQDVAVVRIDGDEAVVVLEDDQLAHARDAAADVGDMPGRGGDDRVARFSVDVDALRRGSANSASTLPFTGQMNWLVAFGAPLFSSSTLAGASILASSGFADTRGGSGGSVSSGRDSTRPRMRAEPTCGAALP